MAPFAHTSGPQDSKIVIVGEAWGAQEAEAQRPFVGASGQELTRMLADAGLDRAACLLTNVFAFQPSRNDLTTLCCGKKDLPDDYALGPLTRGKYLLPEFFPELERLEAELSAHPRNIIIALGNTALWALTGLSAISSNRGVVNLDAKGRKVIGTYHPASVLRNWAQRPIVVADLVKAAREAQSPEFKRPSRTILISPTLKDIEEWVAVPAHRLAVDIETYKGSISCIGFGRSASEALVIPFLDLKGGGNYWNSETQELRAWFLVRLLLEGPAEKIFQNGLYDLTFLLRMGFRPQHCIHDTMLLHHAKFPELNKGLGFLGSIYSNEGAWKLLRKRKADTTQKADDE